MLKQVFVTLGLAWVNGDDRVEISRAGQLFLESSDPTQLLSHQALSAPDLPSLPEWPSLAVTGLVDITTGPIEFTPVPRLRKRRNGWTEETQRLFIEALSECGCVSRAARAVGMTPRSAYRLLESEGAESFAKAWDQAIARGIEQLRLDAIDRAMNGAWVPVMRRGKIVRLERRYNDRLGIALLSGRDQCVADKRERAFSRHRYRRQVLEQREIARIKKQLAEEVWAEHRAVLDRIEAERENPRLRSVSSPPRVRRL